MGALDRIAEQKIAEALREGAFADLPGFGKPLELEDLSKLPEDLRASYIVLQSNGALPPELEARKEWLRLADLVRACADERARDELALDARRARVRYRLMMEQRAGGAAWLEYEDELLERGARKTS